LIGNKNKEAAFVDVNQLSVSSTFYAPIFCTKAHFLAPKLRTKLAFGFENLYEKRARRTLMKLTAKQPIKIKSVKKQKKFSIAK